jgi:hypothetical protein
MDVNETKRKLKLRYEMGIITIESYQKELKILDAIEVKIDPDKIEIQVAPEKIKVRKKNVNK